MPSKIAFNTFTELDPEPLVALLRISDRTSFTTDPSRFAPFFERKKRVARRRIEVDQLTWVRHGWPSREHNVAVLGHANLAEITTNPCRAHSSRQE
ncbi:hypothetical protein CDV36_014369 [Fusarium kuroshium]|uniref:Uncharacterized protein n=2 Tax=Fusarium solani species complex TaxID=232080 RepID=A0A3M2RI74_9HYPO|nr:hypothetical protein CDV36_014369 [Fusarium kuroshium]RSL70163.1 hypothetical protein CEP51_012243 [Fusarium floridanum]